MQRARDTVLPISWALFSLHLACSPALESDDEPSGPPPYSGVLPLGPAVNNPGSGVSPGSGAPGASQAPGNGQSGAEEVPPGGAPLSGGGGGAGGAGMMAGPSNANGGTAPAAAGGASMVPAEPGPEDPLDPAPVPPDPIPEPPEPDVPFEGRGCAAGVAFFCEDFEDLALGAAQANGAWTPSASNGSLSIDGTFARGSRALRVQTQGNGRGYIALSNFAPPGNSFFARMYVHAEAFPRAPDYAHFTLVELAGAGAGLIRPIGGQYIPGQGILWGAGSDRGPTGDWTNWRATAPTEAGRFVCIEWEMRSADNAINIWLDEVAKPELSVSTRSHGGNQVDFIFPSFNSMWIGWELYQGGPTPNQFNFWFDDIVLSTERVGC
jgi:hypothetical protein